MSVVSLPRAFVMRINLDDPHPAPWIRVKLSIAMGRALYPHAQWSALEAVWERLYPRMQMSAAQRASFDALSRAIPRFVAVLLSLRPPALRGRTMGAALSLPDRHPDALLARWQRVKARLSNGSRIHPRSRSPCSGRRATAGICLRRRS